ncbi:hypothetical protein [Clostridium sp.]|uniref:hypothetical protein n=1 Tax=Clostridium sp. TaxID=1506 RepID=UPI002FC685DE
MENFQLERKIKKLDKEIDALKVALKYLSNTDEIKEVRDELNRERQFAADVLYAEDHKAFYSCRSMLLNMLNEELDKDAQKDLLESIKESYGRQYPNASKESNGLNAWLKKLLVECEWKESSNSDWAILVITRLLPEK